MLLEGGLQAAAGSTEQLTVEVAVRGCEEYRKGQHYHKHGVQPYVVGNLRPNLRDRGAWCCLLAAIRRVLLRGFLIILNCLLYVLCHWICKLLGARTLLGDRQQIMSWQAHRLVMKHQNMHPGGCTGIHIPSGRRKKGSTLPPSPDSCAANLLAEGA
jgi:hypothetical protein